MYVLFLISSTLFVGYVLIKWRKIDLFTICGLSSAVFFSPLYFDIVVGPPGYPIRTPEPELYAALAIFNISMFVSALINDSIPIRYNSRHEFFGHRTKYIPNIFGITSLTLFIYMLFDNGAFLFFSTKREMMDAQIFLLAPFTFISAVSITLYMIKAGYLYKFYSLIIAAATLSLGQRTAIALTITSIIILFGMKISEVSILRRFRVKWLLASLAGLLVLVFLKPIYAIFRIGKISAFHDVVLSRNLLELFAAGGEFIYNQYPFNEIILRNFTTDGMHLILSPLSILPIPRRFYTVPSSYFNQLFQSKLFPDIDYGLAYNPFAEFYSVAGLFGVLTMSIIYGLSLLLINKMLFISKRKYLLPLIVIIGSILAFYFYRNSVATTFGFIRIVLWAYLGIILFSSFIYQLRVRK